MTPMETITGNQSTARAVVIRTDTEQWYTPGARISLNPDGTITLDPVVPWAREMIDRGE